MLKNLRMSTRGTPIGLLLAALAECAGISADFVKAGATKEEIRVDNAACRISADSSCPLETIRDFDVERRYNWVLPLA
jgi:hypothetical protein